MEDEPPLPLNVREGAPEGLRRRVSGWYRELATDLTRYGLPQPALAELKSVEDLWMAALYWAPDASHQLVSVSAAFVLGDDDFRAMLSCRPKRRDPTTIISWNDPMWSEVRPLVQALGRTLLRKEEDRARARADWEAIDPSRRTSWVMD